MMMKKAKWKILGAWAIVLSLMSCEHLVMPPLDVVEGEGKQFVVSGSTRAAADAEVVMPVKVYAIAGAVVKDSTMVEHRSDVWRMKLGSGGWTISAMSAWPTWFGSQQLVVEGEDAVQIVLTPAVAQVDFALRGIDAESVSVELSGMYRLMKPTGAYSGATTEVIPLVKTDTAWVGSTYVYPTKGKLNVNIIANDTTYYYAYDSGLDAAYKYHFRGTYEQGKPIIGWITVGNWAGEKVVDFNFGAVQGADVKNVVMSEKVWDSVLSAYSERPDMADSIAVAYDEGGYKWRIPSREEAKVIRDAHPEMDGTDRYLCEGGTYTFSFVPGSSITKAGAKAEYRLVLVR